MKFTKIKKTLCFALAMAMLMAFVPMSAMAQSQLVLEPTADTYIYQYSDYRETPYADNETMYFRRNGNASATGRYGAWPMIQFNLSEIQKYLNENKRKEIDTVKMTLHLQSFDNDNNASGTTIAAGNIKYYAASVEPTDYSTLSWSTYAQQLGSTTVADGVYDMSQAPTGMTELGDVTLCPENTLTAGDVYDFDVTEYVKTRGLAGLQTFVLYPYATNHMTGRFYASEYKDTDSTLIPKLTITFKDKPAPATVQTIGANADTHIRQASSNDGNALKNYSREDLYCTRSGNNTGITTNSNGTENNAWKRYGAWSMVQFDLRNIDIDDEYIIDSVKVKLHIKSAAKASSEVMCYAAPVEPTDYTTLSWSSYAQQLGTANEEGLMQQSPLGNGMTAIDTVTLRETITAGDAYEFDVTDAVLAKGNNGFQTFIFYTHNVQDAKVYFYSMETAEYAPSLTVTIKKAPAPTVTLTPADMVLVAGSDAIASGTRIDTTNHIYQICNFGNNYKTGAKILFDLYDVIPQNKVVTKAELKVYVADTFMTETNNGLRVVNYKDNNWIRDELLDSPEAESIVEWDGEAENARLAGDLSISGVAPLFDAEGKEIHDWVTVDVTEFLSQQVNTEDKIVSFFVTPNKSENKNAKIYNAYSEEYAPQLILTYEDASEQPALTIGTPTFSNPYTGEVMTNFVAGSYLYANIPVSGYSAEGVEGKVILATYFADGSLRYIDEVNDFKFHAGNGSITFALTPQSNAATTKVFVWDANNKSITPTAGVINVEAAVAE